MSTPDSTLFPGLLFPPSSPHAPALGHPSALVAHSRSGSRGPLGLQHSQIAGTHSDRRPNGISPHPRRPGRKTVGQDGDFARNPRRIP
ncbi:hypothetical protein FM114_00385 [Luteococcus japonicus LSP_Lj1]|uniref:Uncharacterized protein n=1 Tax=Luteococcus japonicus LSP_Lj1 TaxID=1255658 RepID=A0A1R4I830_9ACTN|nr:hypothetical protein FM114_00385 [Luteococcus japonicus LSP_Lj1]